DCRDIRIDSDRQINSAKLASFRSQHLRILRHGNRMQVHNAEKTFVVVLQRHPIAQRPEIVSQMNVAGWLCATKNSFHAHMPTNRIRIAIGMTTRKITPNTPVKIARIKRIKPNFSNASNPGSKLSGRMLCKTLLPSRGGIGIKLKTPRATFKVRKTVNNFAAPSTSNELSLVGNAATPYCVAIRKSTLADT